MDYFQLLKQQAMKKPTKNFLITAQAEHSYQEVYQDVLSFVAAYQDKLMGKHVPILILRRAVYDQLIGFLGCMALGQIPILAHYDLPEQTLQQLQQKNCLPYLLREAVLEVATTVKAEYQPQEICMGVLSSGSTDVPKVMYRTYESWAGFFPEQNKMFAVKADSTLFMEGSMSFTGNLNIWAGALYEGATLVISERLNCRSWLLALEKYQVQIIYLVPTKLRILTKFLHKAYPGVTMILAGSQLLEAALAKQLKQGFPHSQILLYYGASELNYITSLTYDELLSQPGSVGRACHGVKVTTKDGYIYVDTPYHVAGITCPFTLRDRGYFNEAGYLIFQGREGDVVNKGGFKINCTKVANALRKVAEVENVVVLAYRQAERDKEIAAFVVTQQALDKVQLRHKLSALLQPGEIPKRIIFVDNIPLNSLGKIDKQQLLALLK